MSPPYLFQIDEIAENPQAFSHSDSRGNWIPSTDRNANYRPGGGVSGLTWFCDKQQIYQAPGGLPTGSQHYKTCSMYYGAGCGIWVLSRDATTMTEQDWEVWHPLRFDHSTHDYSSSLTEAGQHPTLRVQRNGQQWPELLLPDIYRTAARTEAAQYGGLTGELPILLGLLAHSTTQQYVAAALGQSFRNGSWRIHPYGQPRQHQRGVVVSIYTSPANWAGGSTANDLHYYESGQFGKYFN